MRILATRQHEDVADFIAKRLDQEVDRLGLSCKISGRIVLATETEAGVEQGRFPAVSVVGLKQWRADRRAYSALREPIQLVVEWFLAIGKMTILIGWMSIADWVF